MESTTKERQTETTVNPEIEAMMRRDDICAWIEGHASAALAAVTDSARWRYVAEKADEQGWTRLNIQDIDNNPGIAFAIATAGLLEELREYLQSEQISKADAACKDLGWRLETLAYAFLGSGAKRAGDACMQLAYAFDDKVGEYIIPLAAGN
jgi:hypothetical protein